MPARSEDPMTRSSVSTRLFAAAFLLAAGLAASAGADAAAKVLLDKSRVRIVRTSVPPAGGPAAVVVPLEDGPGRKKGEAWWSPDAKDGAASGGGRGAFVVVEPKPAPAEAPD